MATIAFVFFIELAVFLISTLCAARLCICGTRGVWRYAGFWVAALLGALLLLRPHGDTFTALDHSGYRLMAFAFAEGRGFNDVDATVLELPEDVRQDVTLLPYTKDRNTRDRSFRLLSDQTGITEPFFYPTLPLGASILQRLFPQRGMDFFAPLFGLFFALVLLAMGRREGGAGGLLLAAALFLATPLPAMLFRGFYAELCGASLAALAATHWLTLPAGRPVSLAAYLALGLAPAFHPALIVMSLPLLAVLIVADGGPARRIVMGLAMFAIGPAFLMWLTARVCAPYGRLHWQTLIVNFKYSQSHQVVYVFAAFCGLAMLGLLIWRFFDHAAFRRAIDRLRPWAAAWLLLALVPVALALLFWRESAQVWRGLTDLWNGVRWPAAILALGCAVPLVFSRTVARARLLAGLAIALLPVFAYLKGAEQMAMWSQRRLGPFVVLLLPALLLPAAQWMRVLSVKRRIVALGLGGLTLALGLANAVRWPAPYWVQQEAGALEHVNELKERIGSRLVLFDYLPDSFPFAVDNQTRAIGWNSEAKPKHWAEWIRWARIRAATEEVWFASSYSLPLLEEGIRFEPLFTENIPLVRVHSKRALPAVARESERKLTFARVESVGDEEFVQDKLFDGSPTALRAPWGPQQSLVLPEGTRGDGQWSREGSGVIGPIPRSGRIRMTLIAASNQGKPVQRLRVVPPWGEQGAQWLDVTPGASELTAWFDAPNHADLPRTGVYRFYAETPFNPQALGRSDRLPDGLGALMHRVKFAVAEQ
ncbi:MAG: hypothetical protein J5I99_07910 [Verrucomicrobia bacterium]|nr:hypothetical protein [Kiritimatiellia bacterium]MCO6401135.1 hypothetical protein [Verrucomicrobiota bacterium]